MPKPNRKDIIQSLTAIEESAGIRRFAVLGNLSEATIDGERHTAELTVLRKGWSMNGFYYTDKALQDAVTLLNTEARRVFLDHNKRETLFEPRTNEDYIANTLQAKLSEDGTRVIAITKFFESGPNSWIFDRIKEVVNDSTLSSSTMGPSIVGKAIVKQGTAEGRKGNIVEGISWLHSYDIVATPSAGGAVHSVSESLKEGEFYHLEQFDTAEGVISDRMQYDLAKRKAMNEWWDLEMATMSVLCDVICANGDYAYMAIDERKKLIKPTLEEFQKLVMQLTFIEPEEISAEEDDSAVEEAHWAASDTDIKVTFHDAGKFEKNTFHKLTVSQEQGITAYCGKQKNSKRKSTVHSMSFSVANGWTEETAKAWVKANIKAEPTNTKEGVDNMPKTLAELRKEDPTQYELLVAEARKDVDATSKVETWKADSEKLSIVQEELTKVTATVTEKASTIAKLEAEKKAQAEKIAVFEAEQVKARRAELTAKTFAEVGLTDAHISEAFTKLVNAIPFDAAKEDDFIAAVKEQAEDRKSLIGIKVEPKKEKKVVEGVGPTAPKTPEKTTNLIADDEIVARLRR